MENHHFNHFQATGQARAGRHREFDLREIINAILYIDRSGCQWDMIPHDPQAKSTTSDYFAKWRDDGTWTELATALRIKIRVEHELPSPSAACINT